MGFGSLFKYRTEKSPKLWEELIEVTELKKQIPTVISGLWAKIQNCLIAFPSSYLVESGFSEVTNLLTNWKEPTVNNLGNLRILLTENNQGLIHW